MKGKKKTTWRVEVELVDTEKKITIPKAMATGKTYKEAQEIARRWKPFLTHLVKE